MQLHQYEMQEDVLALDIRLCFALVRDDEYWDGNKRAAAAALIEFLAVNSHDLFVPDDDEEAPLLGQWIERLAAGDYTEVRLYDRLEHFVQERPN